MMLQEPATGSVTLEHEMQDPMILVLDAIGLHGVVKTAHASEEIKNQMLDRRELA